MEINKNELEQILNKCIEEIISIKEINSSKEEVKITLSKYDNLLWYKQKYVECAEKLDKIDKIVCRILEQNCNIEEYPYDNIYEIREIICK